MAFVNGIERKYARARRALNAGNLSTEERRAQLNSLRARARGLGVDNRDLDASTGVLAPQGTVRRTLTYAPQPGAFGRAQQRMLRHPFA